MALKLSTDVGVNCKRNQDDLEKEIDWDEWF